MDIQPVSTLPPLECACVGVDIETDGGVNSDPYRHRMVSLQVSDGQSVWILRDNYASAIPVLVNPEVLKIGHGLSFDLKFLNHGLGIETVTVYDTLMAERIITTGTGIGNGLDDVLARRLGVLVDKTIRSQFANHRGEFTSEQLDYMARDVLYLLSLREQQLADIGKAGMGRVLALENSLVPIVAQMELDGVGFDRDLWNSHVGWMEERLEDIKKRVASYLGLTTLTTLFGTTEIELNLSSPDQVRVKLNSLLEEQKLSLNSTKEEVLDEIKAKIPDACLAGRFISDLLEWRGWQKLITSGYDQYVNSVTGKIHTNWNQIQADTGRLSSSGPNLQNVRKPTQQEPNFRHLFPPDPGYVYAVADYSQQEIRVLAEASGDPDLIRAANDHDVYSSVGEIVYKKPTPKGSVERDRVKVGVLGDVFGSGPKNLARQLRVSIEEAMEVQRELRAGLPATYRWLEAQGQFMAQRGYAKSLLGRRRYVPGAVGASQDMFWHYRNIARNMPVQGTAADITKEAMVRYTCWAKEHGYRDARIVLTEHDELVVQVRRDQADMVLPQVVGAMESAMEDLCPRIKAGVDAAILERWDKV